MKKEAKFNSVFNKWLRDVYKKTGAYELKQTSTALPFDAVQEHQIHALKVVRHGTFVFKIPDVGYQNPMDCFSMRECPAYVVISYGKVFHMIDIDTFLLEKSRSKRKSLTQERANAIATISVKLSTPHS